MQRPEVWYGVVSNHDPWHPPPLRAVDHPFLRGMRGRLLRTIGREAVDTTYNPGDLIVQEGEVADRLHLVFHGEIAIEVAADGEMRRSVQTIGEGEVLGWSWALPLHLWPFDARAVKETRVVSIDAASLRRALDSRPTEAYRFLQRLVSVVGQSLESTRAELLRLSAPLAAGDGPTSSCLR